MFRKPQVNVPVVLLGFQVVLHGRAPVRSRSLSRGFFENFMLTAWAFAKWGIPELPKQTAEAPRAGGVPPAFFV